METLELKPAQKNKKSVSAVYEVEVIYKRPLFEESRKITSSKDAEPLFREMYDPARIDYKEFFFLMLLNRANRVLAISAMSSGSDVGTVVSPKEIFQLAIKTNACGIILCHNHPSGNLQPSDGDKLLTKKIKEAAALFDMTVFDHIIITSEGYYSFGDNGLL